MKNILSCLLIVSSLTLTCCGQGDKKDKKEKEQPAAPVRGIPERPLGWVSDFEKVFTPEQINFLDSIIGKHEKETTNEIAIVTYQPDSTQLEEAGSFDKFSLALFNQWGIGKKEKQNGLGILVSVNLRKVRIEPGYGLESKLTSMEAKQIIDSIMLPAFKNNEYFNGVVKALEAIMKEIK
ncbi:MAG TPA: TPM domain-containing protein [Chitinophagaceae bacterium]|jgi:uncharacterized protein|nr:TPM domain-containing protein [Chitinophagaceae bacterium]